MINQQDVTRVVERIAALYDPDRIYVFGSYAKGNATDASDLDLLVVRPTELPRRLRGKDILAILAEMAFRMDLLFVTPQEITEELSDPYSLISMIRPHAKSIYERPGVSHNDPLTS